MPTFGRKTANNAPGGGSDRTTPSSGLHSVGFSWRGIPEDVACNFAVGDIVNNFAAPFQDESHRVHAETFLSALGGVTGYAAQITLRTMVTNGICSAEGLHTATYKDGRQFMFGDPLNDLLTKPEPAIHGFGLWPLAAVATLQTGLAEDSLPELGKQFQAVSERIGTPDEGFPKVDTPHRPVMATAELMKRSWPYTKMLLCQGHPRRPGPRGPVPPLLWLAVMAHAASALLRNTAAALDVRIGIEILMQSAIYGSKLDAQMFE